MTEQAITVRSTGALAQWGSRDEVRELKVRLTQMMLPGGSRLDSNQIAALAQASVAHGLDPLNGEIWIIPGSGVMIGVKGLRKKAREQVKGNFWIDFRRIDNAEERQAFGIPEKALAFEGRLFDSENLRQYSDTCAQLLKAGIPWDAVERMVGSKPYTMGIGFASPNEKSKMDLAQRAMKRTEADCLKRRFDVPFGLAVEPDADAPEFAGEWIEGEATTSAAPSQKATPEQHAKDKAALFGKDEPEPEKDFAIVIDAITENETEVQATLPEALPEPTAPPAVKFASVRGMTQSSDWKLGIAELVARYPAYQTTVKGKTTGQPNMFHVLGAAAKCGFPVIDDSNYELVLEAISKHAQEAERL